MSKIVVIAKWDFGETETSDFFPELILSDPSYKQKARELQKDYAKYDAPELAVRWIGEFIEETS